MDSLRTGTRADVWRHEYLAICVTASPSLVVHQSIGRRLSRRPGRLRRRQHQRNRTIGRSCRRAVGGWQRPPLGQGPDADHQQQDDDRRDA